MVIAGDQVPAWRTEYRSAKEPPCGSIQLKTADPSGVTDQLGCWLPGPEGFASVVAEKVWQKAGSANKALSKSDRIISVGGSSYRRTRIACDVQCPRVTHESLRWSGCRFFRSSLRRGRPTCSNRR